MDTARGVGRALRSQVKPAFTLPAVTTSIAGGLLAPAFSVRPGLGHALALLGTRCLATGC